MEREGVRDIGITLTPMLGDRIDRIDRIDEWFEGRQQRHNCAYTSRNMESP